MSIVNTRQDIDNLLLKCVELKATDLHFSVGAYPAVRVHGDIKYLKTEQKIKLDDVRNIISSIMPQRKLEDLEKAHTCTFSYSIAGRGRFRVNVFTQRGSFCASFRIGNFYCPTKEQLRLPAQVDHLFDITSGLIIISGAKGSGRTATCAYILDRLRQERACFIDTIEDPIEFLFKHDKSVINQMEVGIDIPSILEGLKISLRNYSDIIFISSLIDKDVIKQVLESAKGGKIIIAVTEIQGVAETIKSIIDIFPDESSNYIRTLLSNCLKCVVSQQLIPDINAESIPLCEVLYGIKAVSNIIRENKIPQISKIIETGETRNLLSVDNHLAKLFNKGEISKDTAKDFSQNWNVLSQKLVEKK